MLNTSNETLVYKITQDRSKYINFKMKLDYTVFK